jgi:hypothetical protein
MKYYDFTNKIQYIYDYFNIKDLVLRKKYKITSNLIYHNCL